MNITKMEQTINNNHVFDEIGFDGEYRATTEGFYRPFFESEEQMYKFIISVLQNDDGEKQQPFLSSYFGKSFDDS